MVNEKNPPNDEHRGPPISPLMMKIANVFLKTILKTPLHRVVSKELMLLTFTGRKTGKKYTTPVGTVRQGSTLIVFTHSKWWKNLIGGAPVSVRLQGKTLHGMAFPVQEVDEIKKMITQLIAARGKERAQMMGFWVEDIGEAAPEAVQKATQGTTFIRIDLTEGDH